MILQWLTQWGFAAACLAIPIAWGWLVHWLFERWQRGRGRCPNARPDQSSSAATFNDYQI